MYQDDDHDDAKEIRPSGSQVGVPKCEDQMLEEEIGELFDELTQEKPKK